MERDSLPDTSLNPKTLSIRIGFRSIPILHLPYGAVARLPRCPDHQQSHRRSFRRGRLHELQLLAVEDVLKELDVDGLQLQLEQVGINVSNGNSVIGQACSFHLFFIQVIADQNRYFD